MKILILLPHPIESPGPRFRIYQYLPYFKQAGIEYTISAFLNSEEYMNIYNGPATSFLEKSNAAIKGIARQIHAIADIKSYDGVIVYREAILVGRPWIERYIVKKGIPIIFDFDDAIWMPVKSQTGISPILKRLIKSTKKFDEIMQLSTHIVAGNNYLAQHAQLLNKHVSVIPTVVDTDYYKPSTAKQNRDDIVIGWIGSGSTSVYLKLLDNIWSKLQSPTLPKRDNADVIKRSPSLFKEGGVPERSLGREFKIRFNALCRSLSKRDDADDGSQRQERTHPCPPLNRGDVGNKVFFERGRLSKCTLLKEGCAERTNQLPYCIFRVKVIVLMLLLLRLYFDRLDPQMPSVAK